MVVGGDRNDIDDHAPAARGPGPAQAAAVVFLIGGEHPVARLEPNPLRDAVHRLGGAAGDQQVFRVAAEKRGGGLARLIGLEPDRTGAVGHADGIGLDLDHGLDHAVDHGARRGAGRARVEIGQAGREQIFGAGVVPHRCGSGHPGGRGQDGGRQKRSPRRVRSTSRRHRFPRHPASVNRRNSVR